jgi:hypothetical protein
MFAPAVLPVVAPPRGELLGRLVPTAVRRMPPVARPAGPLRLVWTSVLTLGVLPLIQLRDRLRRTILLQQQQLELAAELLTRSTPPDDAKFVEEAARAAHPSKALSGLSGVAMLGAIGCLLGALQAWGWTWASIKSLLLEPPTATSPFALGWLACLTAGYGLCWISLNHHVGRLQQFALAFNAVAGEKATPVQPPAFVYGVRPLYLLVAAAMMWLWMLWALPMMLAWAAHRTFVHRGDHVFRAQLADALTALSGERPVVADVDRCRNPLCGAPVGSTARYCPRCGKSARVD